MKRNNIFFSLFLFIFQTPHYIHGSFWGWLTGETSAGLEAMKEFAKGVTDTGNLIKGGVIQHSEDIKDAAKIASDALETASVNGKDIAATAGDAAKEAAVNFGEKFGIESTSKIVEVAAPIAKGFLGLATVYQAWCIAGDIKKGFTGFYNWWYPSQEARQREEYYRAQNRYLQAQWQLKHSLIQHQCGPRGASGLPVASEHLAREFALVGSSDELEEITRTFKEYYSLDDCPC